MAKYLDLEGLKYYHQKTQNEFVAKEAGKVLSSNDYTTTEKNKLAGIAEGANKTIVDSELSGSSTNPVQNKVVNAALSVKAPLASPAFTGVPTAPTPNGNTNTTQIATTAFVQALINSKIAAADAMIFKGTIGKDGTVTALPATHSVGWTYKVIAAGTYAGAACEVGDMIVCLNNGTADNNADWTVIQANIDGAVTGPASSVANHVAVFDGTTGKVIKDSGFTIGISVPSNAKFTDTTYTVMKGATSNAAGATGLVPAPAAGSQAKYLRADGTWQTPPDTNTTYNVATASANGLMSSAMVSKLNGIAGGATADSALTTSDIDTVFA